MKDLETLYSEYDANYGENIIRSKGQQDGEKGIPNAQAAQLSPYEAELLHGAKHMASKVAGVCKAKLEDLDARIKAERDKVNRKLEDELRKIEDISTANKNLFEQAATLHTSKDDFEQNKRRFDVAYNKLGRMPISYVPHWMYVVFATIIFLGEIPLNALVFQIFGENQVMTWVMAFVIGLSIPLSAHFVGIKSREHHGGVSWPNVLKALAVAAIIIIAFYGLSVMRHDYLLSNKEALGLDDRLIETSYLFFWLNMAVFGAAVILSYLSHDPVAGYQALYNSYVKSRDRLMNEEKKRLEGIKWTEIAKANEMAKAREEYRAAFENIMRMKGTYDQVLKEGVEEESRCLHRLGRDLSMYRHENLRHRKDQSSPPCFQLSAEFPLELRSIREKLINELESGEATT